ncbi:MAG: hypothetical protein E6K78_08925 [Candidatus Eisenbacteria bacterium]|uniref:Phosphohistidine phosphatase SixA n=1 Tax=Eiseniibacteriota bacterium TaxID=2212470 RepID=A0A538TLS3_UNCEI|nr:MAG: hypothetical protein E6K78_08925 [Candidatus Eisenbacteria bacterium]
MEAGSAGDAARPLSPAGRRAVEELAQFLAGTDWQPDRAFASPLARAQESARILLLPVYEPAAVLAALAERGVRDGQVLLVGHQPLLARLAALLEARQERALAPAGLIRLAFTTELGPGLGQLELERARLGLVQGQTPGRRDGTGNDIAAGSASDGP